MESKDINEPRDQRDFALDGDIEPDHLNSTRDRQDLMMP